MKEPVLGKKNATLKKKLRFKSLRKKFKESNVYGMPSMYIGLSKKVSGLKLDTVYPVYKVETEAVQTDIDIIGTGIDEDDDGGDGKTKDARKTDTEMTLDKDDEDYMEEQIEDELRKRQEGENSDVVVWLLVANKKTGKFIWVDSSDIYYLG